ncbi:hypothetical protein [Porphyromonas endodontalis]|jgi:hypothetical protein|uniref:hypothetical protein n=1 Tax=Porphyromonas endodontalis TaxID=28124 RepID=UPI003619FA2A
MGYEDQQKESVVRVIPCRNDIHHLQNTTQPTNNADKYFQEYFEGVKLLPAIIDEPYKLDMENQIEAICYKGASVY